MKVRSFVKSFVVASAVILVPTAASAATATTTFLVSATVLNTCIVAASPLAFGNYDPTSGTATDSTNTISVTCTASVPYTVALNQGTHGSSVTARLMQLSSDTLPYALYSNAGRTTNWGESVGVDTVAGTGSGILQTHTVYGRIPAGASVPAGAYTDTVTVTVNY